MFFKQRLALDLGTYQTAIYVINKGITLRDYSVVAADKNSGEIVSFGKEAYDLYQAKAEETLLLHPIKKSVIADLTASKLMISDYIKRSLNKNLARPELLVTVPTTITSVEQKALIDTLKSVGIDKTVVADSITAAAYGARLSVSEPKGKLIVDIGAGTTDVGVVSFGELVTSKGIKTAGNKMDEAIKSSVRVNYRLVIDDKTAENLKNNLAVCLYTASDEPDYLEVSGHNLTTNSPATAKVTAKVVHEAIDDCVSEIINCIKTVLEKTPADLVADIMDSGIYLSGGTSQLKRLSDRIKEDIGLRSHVVSRPSDSVILGAGRMLETMNRRLGFR